MNDAVPAGGIRRRLKGFLAGLTLALTGAASFAQMSLEGPESAASQIVRPPKVEMPGRPPLILYYLVVFVVGGAVVYAAVMPSKRTHQD
jgi:hypothetical protein